jgi:hypothetical protein
MHRSKNDFARFSMVDRDPTVPSIVSNGRKEKSPGSEGCTGAVGRVIVV